MNCVLRFLVRVTDIFFWPLFVAGVILVFWPVWLVILHYLLMEAR
jgi:hypothetical protein